MTADLKHDMPAAEYHATDALSVSGAKLILDAPAKYQWRRDHPEHRDAFDLGTVAHALALGDDSVELVEVEAANWMTKAAKEARDEARTRGAVALLAKDMRAVEDMADRLVNHTLAAELLALPGDSEVSAFWTDERTGVNRRARFDRLTTEGVVLDYKTAATAQPDAFAAAVARYGYHQQTAWYVEAATQAGHESPTFAFIAQEKEPPYLVEVFQLDDYAVDLGHRLNARALDIYAECIATDTWPGYTTGVTTLSLPGYYATQTERKLA